MASVSQVCSLWQHIESQEYYAYLAQGKMKVDGQWVECTVYRQCKTGDREDGVEDIRFVFWFDN